MFEDYIGKYITFTRAATGNKKYTEKIEKVQFNFILLDIIFAPRDNLKPMKISMSKNFFYNTAVNWIGDTAEESVGNYSLYMELMGDEIK